jgi:hypothetical protein
VDEFEKPTGEMAYGAIVEIGVTDVSKQDAKQRRMGSDQANRLKSLKL